MARTPLFGSRRSGNPDEVRMTLGEHLEELRSRLLRAIAGLIVGAIVCYLFIEQIIGFILWPVFAILARHGYPTSMKAFNPAEAFVTELKVAVIVGLILSAPYSLTQIWGFVAAGLYPNERKWVHRFAPISIALFYTGAAFLLIVVCPLLLNFLISYRTEYPNFAKYVPAWMIPGDAPETPVIEEADVVWPTASLPAFAEDPKSPPEQIPWINLTHKEIRIRTGETTWTVARLEKAEQRNRLVPDMRIGETIPFILHLAAAFGIGFQVPVVVAFLALIGVFEAKEMARARRYVWFGMAIGSAMLTPPDIGSMMFLLLPMAMLFEVGLIAARLIEPKSAE